MIKTVDKVRELVEQGLDEDAIASQLSISLRAVREYLKMADIVQPVRNQANDYNTIEAVYGFEVKTASKGVPVTIKGKQYMDVTADYIDCGIEYGGKNDHHTN